MGVRMAEEAMKLKAEGGTVCLQLGNVAADNINARAQGFRDTIAGAEGIERLAGENMPLAGLVVNRAGRVTLTGLSGGQAVAAAERLDASNGESSAVTAGLLRLHADRTRIVARESHLRQRFTAAHPHVPTAVMPALSTDVHDLDGLRQVGDLLAG